MRRSGRNQWIGLLVGVLWCAAVAARPAVVACPMGAHHAGGSHGAVQATSDAPASDAHAHHDMGSVPATQGAQPGAPTAPDHGEMPCDCLGDCCATSLVLPGAFSATIAVRISDAGPTPGVPRHEFVGHWIDFVLPFATAPPSMVTG